MKEKGDIEGLTRELRNKDVKIRVEAMKALGELKHTTGLIEALKNEVPEVRKLAISVLEVIDEPEVLDALIDVLYDEEVEEIWDKAFKVASKKFSVIKNGKSIIERLGVELLKSGKRKFALECFKKVADISPEKETFGSIGVVLIDYGLFEDALKYFEKCIELDPTDARGWAGKGAALSGMAEGLISLGLEKSDEETRKMDFRKADQLHKEAIVCCKKALEIDPQFKGAKHVLVRIFYAKGEYEKIIPIVKEILEKNPYDLKARILLAEALSSSNKLSEAEYELQTTLEYLHRREYLEPRGLSVVHQQLGIIYAMMGHRDKAIEQFKKAALANPQDQWSYKLLDAYMILDMFGEAAKGDPQERRAKLLALARKRAVTYTSLAHWESEWSS